MRPSEPGTAHGARTRRTPAACALGLAVLACTLPGCTLARLEAGVPLEAADVAAMRPGMPKSAVLDRLGPPDEVAPLPQGSAFVYYYATQRGADLRLAFFGASFDYGRERNLEDSLMIFFDRTGRVSAVGASRETQQ